MSSADDSSAQSDEAPSQGPTLAPPLHATPCQGKPGGGSKVKQKTPPKDPFDGSTVGVDAFKLVEPNRPLPASPPMQYIFISFDPDASAKQIDCRSIRFVQVIRVLVNGKAISPEAHDAKWVYQKDYTTPAYWCVDFEKGARDPYYVRGSHPTGLLGPGSKVVPPVGGLTPPSKRAGMADSPGQGDGDQPGMAFVGSRAFPGGTVIELKYEFETFACCTAGNGCGKFYEGIMWTWTKLAADDQAGKEGTSVILKTNLPQPSKDFMDAYNLFLAKSGFKPCSP